MRLKCSAITDRQITQAINLECRNYSAKTVVNRWRFIAQVLTWATGKNYPTKLPQETSLQRAYVKLLSSGKVPLSDTTANAFICRQL